LEKERKARIRKHHAKELTNKPEADFQENHEKHFERHVKLSQGRDAIFCVSKEFCFQAMEGYRRLPVPIEQVYK